MRALHLLTAIAVCFIVTRSVIAADLPVIADTYTDSAAGKTTTNYGGNGVIAVAGTRIGLIRFDTSAITAAPVGKATLTLKVVHVTNSKSAVSIHLVGSPWNEKSVTGTTLPAI